MMHKKRSSVAAALLAAAVLGGAAHAQAPPPAPTGPPPGGPALQAPAAAGPLPSINGTVQQLTLTARGDVDGFLLKDGTEVKTQPGLSAQVAASIAVNDRVTVRGLQAAALPLVRAVSIVDETSHRSITEGEAAPPRPPRPRQGQGPASEMHGRVQRVLHGPQGDVNGVLLEDGTTWRFPPERSGQLTALLQPQQTLVAEGIPVSTPWGTVVDVQQIGRSGDHLLSVGLPSGPRRGPEGPPPPPDGSAPPAPPR